ncbi:hypothetical protein JMF89_04105 [Clostridiaceae bacterium UIB06]|uniref:Uncharacterized protein n=1 Tax=Clostridium thailandense TaxID=2794346 RepID=A0A949TVA0_9CLOT|nr:hypothetical protein [Clostridium thailandense]MBV7271633.1 hypothetical protein [Clostridium thailandense]MCH5136397.1 hypothetical protein [Clostridiaceae bacterium UIB06]
MNEEKLMRNGIIFDAKPDAVPYNYRISYKVSVICLIIAASCGRKGCSLIKMHMISYALSNRNEQMKLKEFCESSFNECIIIRFDPVVNRALLYATADGLIVQQVNGLFKLTSKGKKLVDEIRKDKTILYNEVEFLNSLSTKLTEDKIESLMENWRRLYVDDKKVKSSNKNT